MSLRGRSSLEAVSLPGVATRPAMRSSNSDSQIHINFEYGDVANFETLTVGDLQDLHRFISPIKERWTVARWTTV